MYINIFLFPSVPLLCFSLSDRCILAFVSRFCYDCNYSGKVCNSCVSWRWEDSGGGGSSYLKLLSSGIEVETATAVKIIVISKELCFKICKKD